MLVQVAMTMELVLLLAPGLVVNGAQGAPVKSTRCWQCAVRQYRRRQHWQCIAAGWRRLQIAVRVQQSTGRLAMHHPYSTSKYCQTVLPRSFPSKLAPNLAHSSNLHPKTNKLEQPQAHPARMLPPHQQH